MKIALIGNMNNNHFALLRYLNDLGMDAHLFLYSNEKEQFRPQKDTWHWEKWKNRVSTLPVSNGGISSMLATRTRLSEIFAPFDYFIGHGIAPLLMAKMGKMLDLFIPYANGIEFIVEYETNWKDPIRSAYRFVRKQLMERAVKQNVRQIATADRHESSMRFFRQLDLKPTHLPLPMVYREPPVEIDKDLPELSAATIRMRQSELVVFSHVSHIWRTLPTRHFLAGVGKRNNFLIEGFAQFAQQTADSLSPLLCLFKYGPDVEHSERLIDDLGISDKVLWLPVLGRKEIMSLIPLADIGASEFAGLMWGGCGWEFLASGIPMMHMLEEPSSYESEDLPLPPFFNVRNPEEICAVLLENNRSELRKKGTEVATWFEAYQGRALAKKYVELIQAGKQD